MCIRARQLNKTDRHLLQHQIMKFQPLRQSEPERRIPLLPSRGFRACNFRCTLPEWFVLHCVWVMSAVPFSICCSVPGLCKPAAAWVPGELGAGWAHVRRVQPAQPVLANGAGQKGHQYCVAGLFIIQCLEVSWSSGAGHSVLCASMSTAPGDSVSCWHTQ